MRKLTLSLMAAAVALTVGGAAGAQTTPARHEHQPMTRAAVEQRADKAFQRLDANKDGKIDKANRAERQKARFDRIDADHDGQVSFAEFTAPHARRDGARQGAAQRGEQGQRAERKHGEHRMAMNAHRRGFHGRGGHAGFARFADADKDGAVTKAEFHASAIERFERLDANKDGTVTREEAKAARDNMRQQWQSRREARQG